MTTVIMKENKENIWFQKNPYISFFSFEPLPPEIPNWLHTFLCKFYVMRHPFPLESKNDLPLGGYGYFLEPHIFQFNT